MKKIIINENNKSVRIDKFLSKEVFYDRKISRGEIIRLIKGGKILVSNKKVKPSYVLRPGDAISLKFKVKSEKLIPNRNIKIKIIYQDGNIIAIDKPAGISVHPGSTEQNNTLVNGLIAEFPGLENIHDNMGDSYLRPGIVHRLDKETSGVMVIARNTKAFEELKNLFKFGKVTKKYVALVYGKLKEKNSVIEKPIARAATYRKQVIAGRKTKTLIRPAVTEYKVIKEIDGCSLLEVIPKTGRMHQIRVHLCSIGHPVVGDKLYKLKAKVQPFSDSRLNLEIKRHMLHAENIKFELFGKKYSFSSPVPEDFAKLLRNIDEKAIKS